MQALRGYKIFAASYRDDLIIKMVKTPEICQLSVQFVKIKKLYILIR